MTSNPRVAAGVPTGGQFEARQRLESDVELMTIAGENGWLEAPPTRREVDALAQVFNAIRPTAQRRRGDWEASTGQGPTAGGVAAETRGRLETQSRRDEARREFLAAQAAWEASDKSQDHEVIRCDWCGEWYNNSDEPICPSCGA